MANLLNQPPPHDEECEKMAIACVLSDSNVLFDIGVHLNSKMFYIERYAVIYDAAFFLFENNLGVNAITVVNQLEKTGKLEIAGGRISILTLLSSNDYHTSAAIQYAIKIKEDYLRRELYTSAFEIIKQSLDQSIDVEDIINAASASSENISAQTINAVDVSKASEIFPKVLDEYQQRHAAKLRGDIAGCISGIGGVDKHFGGFRNSDLIIIAGRPGSGKTEFALKIARSSAEKGKHILIFSLEMSKNQLVERLILSSTNIRSQPFKNGCLDDGEIQELLSSSTIINEMPIFISDKAEQSVREMKTIAKRYKKLNKCDMIIVDYLQLIKSGTKAGRSRENEVSEFSRGLKNLAKDLDVPVIALSQLNRRCDERLDKRPMLSDLRESGAIEQDADIIMFLYRAEYYYDVGAVIDLGNKQSEVVEKGKGEIINAKYRGGSTGTMFFSYNEEFNKLITYNDGRYIPEETNRYQHAQHWQEIEPPSNFYDSPF